MSPLKMPALPCYPTNAHSLQRGRTRSRSPEMHDLHGVVQVVLSHEGRDLTPPKTVSSLPVGHLFGALKATQTASGHRCDRGDDAVVGDDRGLHARLLKRAL